MFRSKPPQVGAVYRAMGLLTTASPCALVLVPLAYVAAIAAISFRCACPMQGTQSSLHCLLRDLLLVH